MKRFLFVCALLAMPLQAQDSTTNARIAKIEAALGITFWYGPQVRCDTLNNNRPPELPNGEYNAGFQQRRLNCWTDGAAKADSIINARLAIIEAKLATIGGGGTVTRVDTLRIISSVSGTPTPTGTVGDIQLRANSGHLPSQGGITDEYCAQILDNGWDGGIRTHQNFKDNNYSTLCVPSLPAGGYGFESHAEFFYDYDPPQTGYGTGDKWPLDATTAPYYAGRALIIDGGNQKPQPYGGGASREQKRYVMIAAQQKGWPIIFAVTNRPNGYPENIEVMRLDPRNLPSPIEMLIDGKYRKIRSCAIGGILTICLQ